MWTRPATRFGNLDTTTGEEAAARAAFVNAKVILEQYRVKHGSFQFWPLFDHMTLPFLSELKGKHTFFYVPFAPLAEVSAINTVPQLSVIDTVLQQQKWELTRQACPHLIRESLKGLHYLQTHDRFLIKGFVAAAAYLGWAVNISLYILRPSHNFPRSRS